MSRDRARRPAGRRIAVIGAPSSAGAFAVGQEEAPRALRAAGLVESLRRAGADVRDEGDSRLWRWRPDRVRPRAQNLTAVIDQILDTRARVARAAADGAIALVLGGDCTVGMGTVAGVANVADSVGLIYFDLHADLNTPDSVTDGALDWMGVAHMLAVDSTEAALTSIGGRTPLLAPADVVLFGHDAARATAWEAGQIERYGLARIPVEAVRDDPVAAARQGLDVLASARSLVVHLDVDVIDFTDAPLSENTGRNMGLTLADAMAALEALASSDRLAALTITELNPAHASAEEGLLERFAALVAGAMQPGAPS
ncbi:MAG: arginase family protein [Candidatus Limnocylindria bacterium]